MQGTKPAPVSGEAPTVSSAKPVNTTIQNDPSKKFRRFSYNTQKSTPTDDSSTSEKNDAVGKDAQATLTSAVTTGEKQSGSKTQHLKSTDGDNIAIEKTPVSKRNGDVKFEDSTSKQLLADKSQITTAPSAKSQSSTSKHSLSQPSDASLESIKESAKEKPLVLTKSSRPEGETSTKFYGDSKETSNGIKKQSENKQPTQKPLIRTKSESNDPRSTKSADSPTARRKKQKSLDNKNSASELLSDEQKSTRHRSSSEKHKSSSDKHRSERHRSSSSKPDDKSPAASSAMRLIDTLRNGNVDPSDNLSSIKETPVTNSIDSANKIPEVIVEVPDQSTNIKDARVRQPIIVNKVIGASIKSQPSASQASTSQASTSQPNTSQPDTSWTESNTQSLHVNRIDVCRLLSIKTFSNSVDLQINDVKYVCSGAILAYHSPIFEYQLSKGVSIIVLDNLHCPKGDESIIEECLLLLYGGGVILTNRNIEVMIRFAVVYQVENLYRLALEWVRNCISVENVYKLWRLGTDPIVASKNKRKKNDLIHICKNFISGKEVEIAFELKKYKNSGIVIEEKFVLLMLQFTDCATVITDLL